MTSTSIPLFIITEALFLAMVIELGLLLATRKKLANIRKQLTQRDRDNAKLKQSFNRLEKQLEKLKQKQMPQAVEQPVQQQKQPQMLVRDKDDQLLLSYKQRIANLEKFKELYLSLEQHVAEANASSDNSDDIVAALKGVIDNQSQHIEVLKAELLSITDQYQLEHKQQDRLNQTIEQLEVNTNTLTTQLDHAKRQRALIEKDIAELNVYKERVRQAEAVEARRRQEQLDRQQQLKAPVATHGSNPPHGTVRVREIAELTGQLRVRDDEIRRLRQECETIALQYEELAMRSLTLVSQSGGLTDEKKAQLEELKQKLEQSSAELARKQAECEMLENCYLELEESTEIAKAKVDMEHSLSEHETLISQSLELSQQIESVSGDGLSAELAGLREKLTETSAMLNEAREEYQQIKEQFVEVAQEEIELREQNKQLREECDKLHREIRTLQENQHTQEHNQKEMEKLQIEYSKMESRYLALIEKFRDR